MANHTPKPISVPIEPDALRTDVAYALRIVVERARELETTGRTVFDGMVDAGFDDRSEELRGRASRVKCGARLAATLALELESMAGRLDAIALTRQLIEVALDGEGDTEPETTHDRRLARSRR